MAKHSPRFEALVDQVRPQIREITIDQWKMQPPPGNRLLIDVREDSEWARGRIPGAIHLGRGVIERDIETTVSDLDAPLVLYCGGGYRSALAAESLQKMGYRNVFSLAGGWRAWLDSGGKVES